MSYIAKIADITAGWIDDLSDPDFSKKLALGLKQLVESNDVTIILFRHSDLPTLEYFDDPMKGGSHNIDLFVKGAFLIDPFYLMATQKNKRGFFHFKEINETYMYCKNKIFNMQVKSSFLKKPVCLYLILKV